MYKVLAFTCTKPPHEQSDDNASTEAYYIRYISLWKIILDPVPITDMNLSEKKRQEMVTTCFSFGFILSINQVFFFYKK